MISMLTGNVIYHGVGFLILEVNGVGYRIVLPEDVAHGVTGNVTLYTHQAIREDAHELFGFVSMDALELFWKLINVSGVGPKSAQKIIYAGPVDEVRGNIMKGNLTFLTDVPGIGTKTAQKIILELKGALTEPTTAAALDADAIDALVGLGYSRKQAEDALSAIEGETTEARIRAALKSLSR